MCLLELLGRSRCDSYKTGVQHCPEQQFIMTAVNSGVQQAWISAAV